jgi:anti-sigma B factor antagonist
VTACSPAAAPERMLSVTALPATQPGRVVVEVVGEVDTFTAPLLDACLHSQASRSGTSDLVVDLRRVSFLGSAGVRAVVGAERLCRRRGARLSVRCRTGIVQQAVHLTWSGDLVSADPPVAHRPRGHRVGRRQRVHGSVAVADRSAS